MIRTPFITISVILFLIPLLNYSQTEYENDQLDELINELNQKGYGYLDEAKYDSAEYYLSKTLSLQELHYGPNDISTIGSYINLAVVYNSLYDSQKAIRYLSIAEKRLTEYHPNSLHLLVIYNNKGNIYLSQFDYAEAKRYYEFALRARESTGDTTDNYYAVTYFNYIRSLHFLGKLEEENKYTEKIYSFMSDLEDYNIRSLINYSSTLHILNRNDDAIKLLDYAYSKNESDLKKNSHLKSNILYQKAIIYMSINDFDKALSLLHGIISESVKSNEISLNRVLFTHYRIGQAHYLEGNYQKAYSWIDHAIIDIRDELLSKLDTTKVRSVMTSLFDFTLLYKLKAKTARALYDETKEKNYLLLSFDTYSELIANIRDSRINMKNEESVLNQSDTRIETMYEAVEVAVELYQHENDNYYLEKAFEFNESFKASSLSAELKRITAIEFSDLPTEIKYLEDSLSNRISSVEQRLYDEQIIENPDQATMVKLDSMLFVLKDDYNDLIEQIEIEYPNYFSLKYNSEFSSLNQISENLHKDQALAEYVLADSLITIFVVDSEQTRVVSKPIDSLFAEECIEYYRLLQSQEFDKGVHETYEKYVRLSRKFYQTLVEPVREITPRKEIIFVPDGELMYLPFETFLTEDVDDKYIDYLSLPYLIHELSIGYSYSATLLFNNPIRRDAPEDKVLAFAPAYDNLLNLDQPLVWNRQSNPHFLIPLDGAREEVKNLSSMLPAHTFMDYEATEANFKKYASDYSVLHLAMHTIMNDEEPMFSRLAFARAENDTTEDHDLFTYEIYNLNLNADMVVLSSCSSGYGKMQKGEGMMSMARGFLYAGCPTIVMTLWQVSDKSSAELMSSFYKYLRRGKTKNEALRLAKIDYIKSSDKLKSNPYFWSSFLVVGDSSPLYAKKSTGFWFLLILITVVILFAIRFRKEIVFRLTRQGF